MSKSVVSPMTEEQAKDMESRLNTDTDALVSSILTNEDVDKFVERLESFIAKKNADISAMCGEHSLTFSKSIEGAQSLGEEAASLEKRVVVLQEAVEKTVNEYREKLTDVMEKRQRITRIDQELAAISEALVVMQRLENINSEIGINEEEIERKKNEMPYYGNSREGEVVDEAERNYYIAVVRCLEFADYDSKIAPCKVIQDLQKDVDNVLSYIESTIDQNLRVWMGHFREKCCELGACYLYGGKEPEINYGDIYETYMVKKHLGGLEAWRRDYEDRRIRQLQSLIDKVRQQTQAVPTTSSMLRGDKEAKPMTIQDNIRLVLSTIAGWFLAEAKISSDGFCLISQSTVDEMWKKALGQAQKMLDLATLGTGTTIGSGVNETILLAQEVSYFSEKMELCSLSCDQLHDWMRQKTSNFKMSLVRQSNRSIKMKIDQNSQGQMVVNNQEEYAKIAKYNLCDIPSGFPAEMTFVPALPMILDEVDDILDKWNKFTGRNGDEQLINLYTESIRACYSGFSSLGKESSTPPICALVISTLNALMRSLTYFDTKLQQSCPTGNRLDTSRIKKEVQTNIDATIKHVIDIFKNFIYEVMTPHSIHMMQGNERPDQLAEEFVLYFDATATFIQMVLDPHIFNNIVENIAKIIAQRLNEIITTTDHVKWSPNLISMMNVNIKAIANSTTFIANSAAKQHLSGLTNMLSYLLSNQLVTIISDPQFVTKNKNLPWDSMLHILQNYEAKARKDVYVIPSNLVKTLIQKYSPLGTKSGAKKR